MMKRPKVAHGPARSASCWWLGHCCWPCFFLGGSCVKSPSAWQAVPFLDRGNTSTTAGSRNSAWQTPAPSEDSLVKVWPIVPKLSGSFGPGGFQGDCRTPCPLASTLQIRILCLGPIFGCHRTFQMCLSHSPGSVDCLTVSRESCSSSETDFERRLG